MEFGVQLSIFRVLPKSYPKQGVEVKHQQRWGGQVPARPPAQPGCQALSSPKLMDLVRSLLPVSCGRMQGDNIREEENKHPVGTQGSEMEDLEFFAGAGQGQAEGGPGAAQPVRLRTRSPDRWEGLADRKAGDKLHWDNDCWAAGAIRVSWKNPQD